MRAVRLARTLETWREHAKHQRRLLRVGGKAMQRMRHRGLATALGRWVESVAELRRQRRVATKVLSRMVMRAAALAFESWRAHAIEQRRLLRLSTKVVLRLFHRGLATALGRWVESVAELRRQKRIVTKVLSRMVMGYAASALDSWRGHAAEQRRLKRVGTRVVMRMLGSRLAAAFGTWLELAGEAQRRRGVTLRVVARMRNAGLAEAFSTWRDGHRAVREVAARAAGAAGRLSGVSPRAPPTRGQAILQSRPMRARRAPGRACSARRACAGRTGMPLFFGLGRGTRPRAAGSGVRGGPCPRPPPGVGRFTLPPPMRRPRRENFGSAAVTGPLASLLAHTSHRLPPRRPAGPGLRQT